MCKQSASGVSLFDSDMVTHTRPRSIITYYLHSYAVFLRISPRCWSWKLSLGSRTCRVYKEHTHTSRRSDIFATYREYHFLPLTPSYEAQHSRKVTKVYLKWTRRLSRYSIYGTPWRVFVRSTLYTQKREEKRVHTYPAEFFRQPFERLIHLCRQAKLRPSKGAVLLAAHLATEYLWYALSWLRFIRIYCFWTLDNSIKHIHPASA